MYEVADYWEQVIKINNYQKNRFSKKVIEHFNNNLRNISISILGWSFKKNTNDSRESASIYVCRDLLLSEAQVHIYDPMVSNERIISDLKGLFSVQGIGKSEIQKLISNVYVYDNIYNSILNSNAILILTEWDEFKSFDWKEFFDKSKSNSLIFDARNIIDKSITQKIYSIGN